MLGNIVLSVCVVLVAYIMKIGVHLSDATQKNVDVPELTADKASMTATGMLNENELKAMLMQLKEDYKIRNKLMHCFYNRNGIIGCHTLTVILQLCYLAESISSDAKNYGDYIRKIYKENADLDCFKPLQSAADHTNDENISEHWNSGDYVTIEKPMHLISMALQVKAMYFTDAELITMIGKLANNQEIKDCSSIKKALAAEPNWYNIKAVAHHMEYYASDEEVKELYQVASKLDDTVEKYRKSMSTISHMLKNGPGGRGSPGVEFYNYSIGVGVYDHFGSKVAPIQVWKAIMRTTQDSASKPEAGM